MNEPSDKSKVQGEGDYDAARRFDKAERQFVESGKVREGADKARPGSAEEQAEMEKAEDVGKSHSKGELPADEKSDGKGSGKP
jgi:hypothetical protein